jgi:hypothetical protein
MRRCINSGKASELLIKALETQAESEGVGVFEEKIAYARDVRGRFS